MTTTTPASDAADLRTAAQAVIDRWDTPLWKDVPATAEYIGRLRAALAVGQATAAQPVAEPAKNDTAYAELPEPDIAVGNDGRARIYTCKDIVGEPYYTADQLRAFADATHTLRASHGQAPAGAAEEIDKALNVYAQAFAARVNGWTRQNGDDLPGARSALFAAIHAYAQASTLPTTSPQADSVLEDAARLDFLIDQGAYVVSDPDTCTGYWLHWARPDGSTWVQIGEYPTPRAAIDEARKQEASKEPDGILPCGH